MKTTLHTTGIIAALLAVGLHLAGYPITVCLLLMALGLGSWIGGDATHQNKTPASDAAESRG